MRGEEERALPETTDLLWYLAQVLSLRHLGTIPNLLFYLNRIDRLVSTCHA